uniref:Activin types I and II receptor domain-containing protein n=1 Tax=Strongyloides stercoralis TaxID=6248 RepID=A0A0K0E6K8_STRER
MSISITKDTNPTTISTTTKEINHSKGMLDKLYIDYKLQNENSCDIKIIINGKEYILTHKILLEAHSPFFRNTLQGKKGIIELNDPKYNLKLMKLMLKYLYKGTVNVDLKKYLENFRDMAKKLEMEELYNKLAEVDVEGNVRHKKSSKMIGNKKSKKMVKSERSTSKKKSRRSLKKKSTITKDTSSVKKRNNSKSVSSSGKSKVKSVFPRKKSPTKARKMKYSEGQSLENNNNDKSVHSMMKNAPKSRKQKMKCY